MDRSSWVQGSEISDATCRHLRGVCRPDGVVWLCSGVSFSWLVLDWTGLDLIDRFLLLEKPLTVAGRRGGGGARR